MVLSLDGYLYPQTPRPFVTRLLIHNVLTSDSFPLINGVVNCCYFSLAHASKLIQASRMETDRKGTHQMSWCGNETEVEW